MGQFIAPKATTTQRLTIIPAQGELLFDTTVNKLYGGDGTTTGGFLIGNGDVSGPSSAVSNRVVFFDGTSGKLIKDSGLTLSGTNTGDQTITLTGDVTGSGTGSFAATISAGSVTLAKMANLAANSIIGNNTVSAATPIALSGTQVTAMLDVFSSTLKGLAPASGGGTTNFLRADGTWASPSSGSGTVTSVSALTLGTTGTDLSSTVANSTTTPVITLNVPTASSTARGVVSSSDWINFQSAYTNRISSLTVTGSSGSATLSSNVLNIPTYTLSGLGGQPLATNLTSLSSLSYTSASFVKMTAAGTFSLDTTSYYPSSNPSGYTSNAGTVTSVSALTLGTSGTDLSSTVATGTTTPVITLNVPTASATNRGVLSSTDWSTFNGKQDALSGTGFVKISGTIISYDNSTYLTANQTITLSGDVSGSGTTAITTTIGANKVTNSMLSQVSTATFKGRTTAGTGNVEDLTATQATALLDTFTSSLKGLTPASGGGTTNFLRADGTWAAPGGGGTPGGSNTQIQYNSAGSFAGSANFVWDNTNTRLGIAQSTPTSRFHLNFNVNSETQSDANGILLANSTAAILNLQSISPAIVWQGNGWKTLSTAASQDVRFRADMLPTQGAANPSGTWRIASNINNAGYTTVMSVSSGGAFYASTVNSGGQFGSDGSGNSTIKVFKLTNAGGNVTPQLLLKGFGTTAGILGASWDDTNQLTFHASNGTSQIARAAIQIVSLTNTAGAETGDLAFFTQTGGTAIAERMRIFANGNVSIGGTSNAGYKLDVAGQTRLQFDVTISDTRNFIFSTSSGTKFGTATGQKIAFWNKTPIAQPTTAITAATFVANTSLIANDTATYGGYTIGQIAAALINMGILA